MIFGVHINQILTNVQKQFSISFVELLSVVMFLIDFFFFNLVQTQFFALCIV